MPTSITPLAARIAGVHGLDPAGVVGSGRGGRITKQDVLAHLLTPTPPARTDDDLARRGTHTRPQVASVIEVDLSAVIAHRDAHQPEFARQGVRLTHL